MLGILPAKGLEFPDVVLVNFFCRHNAAAHNSDAALKRMMALQGYTGPTTLEEAKAHPSSRAKANFEKAHKDAKRALDAQAAEGQKNERARQRAWKWLLSQHRGDPPPIPREVEVDLKLLYTAISRCSNRMYFVETAASEAGTEWKKWLLTNALVKCAEEDYEVKGSETDRERWADHKSRGLELAAEAADSAEDGESGDLFEQAAASFRAAGELELGERVRIQAQSYRSSTAEWTVEQLVQHVTQLVQYELPHEATLLCESWAEEKAASAEGLDIQLAQALTSRLRSICGIHDGRAHLAQPASPLIGPAASAASPTQEANLAASGRAVNTSNIYNGDGVADNALSKRSLSKDTRTAEGQTRARGAEQKQPMGLHEQHPISQICCSQCGVGSTELQKCARCQTTMYCSLQCQTVHWRAGHKHECAQFVD
jgi:hypothetical protein